jgi:chromate transporter
MLTASWGFERYGWVSAIQILSSGLGALVVGIMFGVVADFGRRNLRSWVDALFAGAAFGSALLHISAIAVVVAGLILGALLGMGHSPTPCTPTLIRWRRLAAPLLMTALVFSVGIACVWSTTLTGKITLVFLKIGATAFGNGATILPVMREAVVQTQGWISPVDFNVAVALGNLTPGPILNSATFVGYHVDGLWGALAATLGIFSPSFAMTLVFTELFDHIRHRQAVNGAIRGVMSSFVGLLAATALVMAVPLSGQPAPLVLATMAFLALRFTRLGLGWIFLVGLMGWFAFMWVPVIVRR